MSQEYEEAVREVNAADTTAVSLRHTAMIANQKEAAGPVASHSVDRAGRQQARADIQVRAVNHAMFLNLWLVICLTG